MNGKPKSEYRQDPLNGEWVLVNLGAMRSSPIVEVKPKTNISHIVHPYQTIIQSLMKDPSNASLILKDRGGSPVLYVIDDTKSYLSNQEIDNRESDSLYTRVAGYGVEELILYHDAQLPVRDFSVKRLEIFFEGFQKRGLVHMTDKKIDHIFYYHNHGEKAGAHSAHPHANISASAIIPDGIERLIITTAKYYQSHQRNIFEVIQQYELRRQQRVVSENVEFIAICPYASQSAYQIDIYPKEIQPHFEYITPRQRTLLAQMFQKVLRSYYEVLGDIDYTMYIISAPVNGQVYSGFSWFIRLVPRITLVGGYSIGSDMDIVSVSPEESARILSC